MMPQGLFLADPCVIAPRWLISLQLAEKLVLAADRIHAAGLGVTMIISGFRTCEQQQALKEAGRPAAPCDRSTHTTCPATGADVYLPSAATDLPGAHERSLKLLAVSVAESVGLRVGGGGPVERDGLPVDWNHWDLGPRV